MDALTIFAGLALLVSAGLVALAILTRPREERPCTGCINYTLPTPGPGKSTYDTWCKAGGKCGAQRKPGPYGWVPVIVTGRCGPQGRHWAPR